MDTNQSLGVSRGPAENMAAVSAIRTAPRRPLAWTLVRNFAAGRDDVFVRWLEGDDVRETQLGYWLSYDDHEQLHSVKFIGVPTYMNRDALDELKADVLAYHQVESTDWMEATRAKVVDAVPVVVEERGGAK